MMTYGRRFGSIGPLAGVVMCTGAWLTGRPNMRASRTIS
jgi:hypothetical protein